ncbi:MAG: 50S ribosomal protein P1 [Candidatus Diapherotrites archaeon]|nr:50S ribosomal protein P1 [Candidatus Diapherotrites archaeon]
MEYVYSAMLLHSAGKEITEGSVTSILKSAGLEADSSKVKALIASLKNINIDEAIAKAAVAQVAVAAGPAAGAKEAKAEVKEEEGKTEEEAAQGLSALFG